MKKLNIGILASTRGTDMQAIIDEIESGKLDAIISIVISNKDCYALERAKKQSIPTAVISTIGKTREEFDKDVAALLDQHHVELILLIGYMRILSNWFVRKYKNKIMNIHPSLLPAFSGGMDKNVHETILKYGCKVSGCTLHFVDEGVDTGPIIAQKAVIIEENETVETLKEKVQKAEQEIILQSIRLFKDNKLKVQGRIVHVLK